MPELLKLPLSFQEFRNIRETGRLYVDKTKYLLDLIDADSNMHFSSRPRRFGKSLTVSTLDSLFSGEERLFKCLAAEEYFGRPGFRPYPVIRLDMSRVSATDGFNDMGEDISDILDENARRHGVALGGSSPGRSLSRLIRDVYEAKGPVVVLVDEYDKPFLDFIDRPEEADRVREVLRKFYTRIKAENECLRFAFITGISKFTKMGVFSGLNNLRDISMSRDFAAMYGYTQKELEENFSAHLDATAAKLGIGKDELIESIRDYYDGFSFDGKTKVYNPYSTLLFFVERKFLNFWVETGNPSFLAKYMAGKNLTVDEFRGKAVSKNFASSPGNIDPGDPKNFLYQAGFLSLREGKSHNFFNLDYPNREVRDSMSRIVVDNAFGGENAADDTRVKFSQALYDGDAETAVAVMNRLFAAIPYKEDAERITDAEYRGWMLTFLNGTGNTGVKADPAETGAEGEPDFVVTTPPGGRVWVMGLKVSRGIGAEVKRAAEAGMKRLRDHYGGCYEDPILLSLVVHDGPSGEKGARRIAAYLVDDREPPEEGNTPVLRPVDDGEPPEADVEEWNRPGP
jgi:hypothetical protein